MPKNNKGNNGNAKPQTPAAPPRGTDGGPKVGTVTIELPVFDPAMGRSPECSPNLQVTLQPSGRQLSALRWLTAGAHRRGALTPSGEARYTGPNTIRHMLDLVGEAIEKLPRG